MASDTQLLQRIVELLTPGIKKSQYGQNVQSRRGAIFDIAAGQGVTVTNANPAQVLASDENVSEWVVKCAPTQSGVAALQANESAATGYLRLIVEADYELGLFTGEGASPQSFSATGGNYIPLIVPPFGRCYQAHGTLVRATISRFLGQQPVQMGISIVPGRIQESVVWETPETISSPSANTVNIPNFATEWCLVPGNGANPADIVEVLDTGNNVIQTITGPFSSWQPINPQGMFLKYSPAGATVKNYFAFKVRS